MIRKICENPLYKGILKGTALWLVEIHNIHIVLDLTGKLIATRQKTT